ncbi:MAG TPA: sugar ABC transporter substrate-binding protein [Solirubrobacteraceae bacterium]|jgi:ribose transport system substrate-binding protein|nr:sugar ABC transporter substrate-binding protein [Solirubrobacteraceae bacterium]
MRRFAKCFVPLALVAAVVVAMTASAAPAGAATSNKVVIGYINEIDAVPFVTLVKKSVVAAAKKAGVTVKICNPNGDAQKAVDCAAQFKAQGVQGILNFQANEAAGPRVCAAGPKVPVIAFDIHQKPCETIFFGADNSKAGELSGEALGKFSKKKFNCQVDAFVSMEAPAVGVVNTQRANGMIRGYKSVCKTMPKVTRVDGKGATNTSIQPATDTLSRLTGKHKILVVSLNDDMAIGMIKAAQSSNRLDDIYVGAQGADPTSWPYLCGKQSFKNWEADTAYFPERYGNVTVPLLLNLIKGKTEPKVVYTKHKVVTPSNIKSIYPTACK